MPKVGMEPIRRAAVVRAAIDEIGEKGSLDITVSQIARRAGMSSGLAHHYFGGKDQIFLAAMRHTMSIYGTDIRNALARATDHRGRLVAIIKTGFSDENFRRETIAAWLNFYVLAQISPEAARLLRVYRRRLASNLIHDLKPLVGARAGGVAARISGLIDGLYLHCAQDLESMSGEQATAHVVRALDNELEACL